MTNEKNYGLLMAVDWNSNKWAAPSTEEDLLNSDFGFVKEHGITYSCLNFAHMVYPCDEEGYYSGLLPQLWTKTLDREKSFHVKIAFLKSKDYVTGKLFIIGFYAFPKFGKGTKKSPIPEFPMNFEYNIRSKPEHIHILEHPVDISSTNIQTQILPKGKDLGKQGFNYLHKEHVLKIFDIMRKQNPTDAKLQKLYLSIYESMDGAKMVKN